MSTNVSVPAGAPAVPLVTVTHGAATPAELAVVLAVLLAVRSAPPAGLATNRPAASRWTERARARAAFPRAGPQAWRASALPR